MNVFMITRGSQGDVFPYLSAAAELIRRGHHVAVNLPVAFKAHAERLGVKYYLQTEDDIEEIMQDKFKDQAAIGWIERVMDHQCRWLPDVLKDYDVLVSSNTEMAAPTLTEYFGIPLIRTAFAPILPSRTIPPPLIPFPVPNPVFTPRFLWFLTRIAAFPLLKKTINRNRRHFGLKPLKRLEDFRMYTSGYGNNAVCYSPLLVEADPEWDKLSWTCTGYCFHEDEPYDEKVVEDVLDFIEQDSRPVIFFTIGSCEYPRSRQFFDMLLDAVKRLNYRLIVGAGWSKSLNGLASGDDVCVLKGYIPHSKVVPHCDAILHHAGSGTTHMAVKAGIPQLQLPLIIDQHFWSYQCYKRGLGPHWLNEKKLDVNSLVEKLIDLVTNPRYKENARRFSDLIKKENGVQNFCDYICKIVTEQGSRKPDKVY